MRLFIAAPWCRRYDASQFAQEAEKRGYTITYKWWLAEALPTEIVKLQVFAGQDYLGIGRAEVFVLLNLETSEGKAVEQGIALAHYRRYGTPLLLGIGDHPSNIYQNLQDFHWVQTAEEAFAWLDDQRTHLGSKTVGNEEPSKVAW